MVHEKRGSKEDSGSKEPKSVSHIYSRRLTILQGKKNGRGWGKGVCMCV
jgi:hypothetical protein